MSAAVCAATIGILTANRSLIMSSNPNNPVTWRSHLSLILLALVYIFSYIDRQAIAIVIEPIKHEFGVSDTVMGLLTGLAFGLLYAGLGVPIGKLADRSSRRNIIAVCCTLWSFATMGCGLAHQFWLLMLARMGVAVGEAGGMAPSISLVSDLYPKERRSLVISFFMMGPNIGVLVGLALGGWIAQTYGWRTMFIWFGAPGIVLGLLVLLLVREPRREAVSPAAAVTADAGDKPRLRSLLATPAFRNLALACGICGLTGYSYGIWIPTFLVRTHNMSLAHAGLIFGVASGVSAVCGAMFSGSLCDRLVQRDTRWQLRMPMLGVLFSIPMALALLLWPPGGHWMLGSISIPFPIVFAVLFSFFASWWPALSYTATSHMVKANERSMAAATLNLFITLFGVGLGPLATGFVSDLLTPMYGPQALRYSLVIMMSLSILSVILYGLALKPYKARLAVIDQAAVRTA